MKVIDCEIQGLKVIEPSVFGDARGYFFESYNEERFHENGITEKFVQDNESFSTRGILRGLHFQTGEHAQAKLVRVVRGAVLDVAVDLRKDSTTFGRWMSVELTEENHRQFLVPRGFAHGFVVLSETAIFQYKCDNFYNQPSEGGILFSDETLNIDWRLPKDQLLLSDKDKILPSWKGYMESPCF